MRRPIKKKEILKLKPDFKYDSLVVAKLINCIMLDGKKSLARRLVDETFDIISKKTKNDNPLEVFEEAIKNVSPLVEVKSKRIGGANYQVPVDVRPERKTALAFRWILEAARAKKGSSFPVRLSEELILASQNDGTAVKKKENVHKMAEANRAFAHFAR